MCGIAGISITSDCAFNVAALSTSLVALKHRGPNDSGIFTDDGCGIGLVHARLSIIDLSSLGHQPMLSDDGLVALVFNGEIYNFPELRTSLEARGFCFRGNSDTEVLLNLYLADGEDMLSKLNGVFAFAIFDKRKQALFLVRDALGVKPLYYSCVNGIFAFASEIKALLHLMSARRELDIPSLHRYLSFLWCPGDGTPLKSVRKVLPGEAMWVKKGIIEKRWSWYRVPVSRVVIQDLKRKSALEGVVSHLREAVSRQMISDVPVGAFLSGGLDSSSIVAFAREKNPNIHCFTIESDGTQEDGFADDLPYARQVAKHLNVQLDVVAVSPGSIVRDIEKMVEQMDEPIADPAALNVLYISQLARSQGIKVLLSGVGGDDLFTGYRRHRALNAEKYWSSLPLGFREILAGVISRADQRNVFSRRLNKFFSGASLSGDARLVNYFKWVNDAELEKLYTTETREALSIDSVASRPMLDFLMHMPTNATTLDRMLALEQRFFLADHNLNYTDKMSMAVGVEVRVPFLDLELVDFAARIPNQLKQRGAEGKWILKKAMEPYLPHNIIYRPKTGFGIPLRKWMRHELRELLCDLLSVESIKRRGLFNPSAVQTLIFNNHEGKVDSSYTLFSLLCIEIWCRRFIDVKL